MGHGLDGGCFYPSCWVAAVHALREGSASRIAYIDIDAHKPDGIWKEMQQLRGLGKEQRTMLLGKPNRCEEVLFASVHIDDYPNPEEAKPEDPQDPKFKWNSVDCILPKTSGKAFPVSVLEELLPRGLGEEGTINNDQVLERYQSWQNRLSRKLRLFKPNGIFVGMGFDLHISEKQIPLSKRPGIGMESKHYREVLASLPASSLKNSPVVLTLEGGYTKEAVMDGMRGVLDGLVDFANARGKGQSSNAFVERCRRKRKALHSETFSKPTKKSRTLKY